MCIHDEYTLSVHRCTHCISINPQHLSTTLTKTLHIPARSPMQPNSHTTFCPSTPTEDCLCCISPMTHSSLPALVSLDGEILVGWSYHCISLPRAPLDPKWSIFPLFTDLSPMRSQHTLRLIPHEL